MAVHYAKLIDSTDAHDFQSQLQRQLYALDDPSIAQDSIQISFAVGPGPHFAAVVMWVDIEMDLAELGISTTERTSCTSGRSEAGSPQATSWNESASRVRRAPRHT
jgi:hypothetical protein